MLIDKHGRAINYLRLAVTDRCNLRCFYCMPEEGLDWTPRKELMTDEEMLRLCTLLVQMGISKIRITGGEPFVRKDILIFLSSLSKIKGLEDLTLTTNGILTAPFVSELKSLGIKSVNLSLDTLNRDRFLSITRRDELPRVLKTFDQLLLNDIEVKLNAVVMDGKNTEDILPMVQLTKTLPVTVRFIEEMPFNGKDDYGKTLHWNHVNIIDHIRDAYPLLQKIQDPPHSTASNYFIPGHKGAVGVIAAYTRSFCGTCNRIRITPQGVLKNCLYDSGGLNLKKLVREGLTNEEISKLITSAVHFKAKDGWEAEYNRNGHTVSFESMAAIGG